MRKLRVIQSILEKMMWLAPILIVGIGIIPEVAGSIWWDAIGGLLLLAVLIICVKGWYHHD